MVANDPRQSHISRIHTMITIAPELRDLPHYQLADLLELQGELKDLTERNAAKLRRSIAKHGIFVPFFVWPAPDGNTYILDGHQRKRTLVKDGHGALPVPCVLVHADTLPEAKEKLLVISSQYGRITQEGYDEFTFDLPDVGELVHFDALAFEFATDEDEQVDEGDNYSRKIESPHYEPSEQKPKIADLYDATKTGQLIREIEQAEGLTDEEREFLRVAAQRHTVLNFKRIADYYAHSPANIQRLMENNALVIIDFNRAIELGFVQLTKEIAEMVRDEYGDD